MGSRHGNECSGTRGSGDTPIPGRLLNGKFVSQPIRVDLGAVHGKDVDCEVVFYGVDQSGPSYEARVFLNNTDADAHAPLTPEHGYAGSFHVYGYGLWTTADEDARENQRARAPMTRSLVSTTAIRRALASGPEITVTVVTVKPGQEPREPEPALRLDGVSIVCRKTQMPR